MRTMKEIDRMVRIEVSNLVLDIIDSGMSYADLAIELNVDVRSLRRWKNGECIPNGLYLEMLRELREQEGKSDDLPSHFLFGHVFVSGASRLFKLMLIEKFSTLIETYFQFDFL